MVYFIILLFYTIALIASVCGGFLLRFTRFKPASRYVMGAALGTLPGLIAANAVLWAVLYALSKLVPTGSTAPVVDNAVVATLGAVAVVGAMVMVPVVASVLGIMIGAAGGIYIAWRMRQ